MKWLPNTLSLGRILAAPLIAWLIYAGMIVGDVNKLRWAFGLFVASAVTDWLDGYLARKLDAKSALGGKLDLWGDKALVGLCLVALWLGWLNLGNVYANPLLGMLDQPVKAVIGMLLLLALPGRDAYVTQLRARLETRGIAIPPTFLAKSKTAVVMAALAIILAGLAHSLVPVMLAGLVVLCVGAVLSLWTAWAYVQRSRESG
jgi:phosphatidylglycerophosphate synthase